jgi:hypothetical protein
MGRQAMLIDPVSRPDPVDGGDDAPVLGCPPERIFADYHFMTGTASIMPEPARKHCENGFSSCRSVYATRDED